MLEEMIREYVKDHNVIITSPTHNGASSFTQYIMSELLDNDVLILYYNPSKDFCREFTSEAYPRLMDSIIILQSPLENLSDFLEASEYDFDYLVIDPGDVLLDTKPFISRLSSMLNNNGSHLICTSQIRVNPNTQQVYSTLEEFNKRASVFDFSLWLRKSTGPSIGFVEKYLDVFETARIGNRYKARYITKFTTDGKVLG